VFVAIVTVALYRDRFRLSATPVCVDMSASGREAGTGPLFLSPPLMLPTFARGSPDVPLTVVAGWSPLVVMPTDESMSLAHYSLH
jgi:hypothetical protein